MFVLSNMSSTLATVPILVHKQRTLCMGRTERCTDSSLRFSSSSASSSTSRRPRRLVVRNTSTPPQQEIVPNALRTEETEAIQVLRTAAKDTSVKAKDVFQALRTLDKAKPKGIEFDKLLPGPGSTLQRWRLAYTAGAKEIVAASKGKNTKGGAYWGILPACIGYRKDGLIENGVYLGHVGYLKFIGHYELTGNKVPFDFTKLELGIGPWTLPFQLKKEEGKTWSGPGKAPGLFIMIYCDDEILAARGKSGGLALWAKTTPLWELENGVH